MKKIIGLVLLLTALLLGSCCESTPTEEICYMNTTFKLVDKLEGDVVVDGNTVHLKTWVIEQDIMGKPDHVLRGKIHNNELLDAQGKPTLLTDALWVTKQVGDPMYFDHILKSRFSIVKRGGRKITKVGIVNHNDDKSDNSTTYNLNALEKERKILEIEREKMALERQLYELNSSK